MSRGSLANTADAVTIANGGLVGKISKIAEENDFIVISLNNNSDVTIKKDFVTAVLPKGTIQSL